MKIRTFGDYDAFLRPSRLLSEEVQDDNASGGGKKKEEKKEIPGAAKKEEKKKFLGKFDSEEEAEEALKNLERRLTDQGEDIKYLQEENERLTGDGKAVRATTREDQEVDVFKLDQKERVRLREAPEEVIENYGRRIYAKFLADLSKGSSRQQAVAKYARSIHTAFYQDNPDLVGRELIVSAVSAQVQEESPGVPPHRLLGKVAERVRKELDAMGVKPARRGTRSEDDTTRHETRDDKRTSGERELDKTLSFGR